MAPLMVDILNFLASHMPQSASNPLDHKLGLEFLVIALVVHAGLLPQMFPDLVDCISHMDTFVRRGYRAQGPTRLDDRSPIWVLMAALAGAANETCPIFITRDALVLLARNNPDIILVEFITVKLTFAYPHELHDVIRVTDRLNRRWIFDIFSFHFGNFSWFCPNTVYGNRWCSWPVPPPCFYPVSPPCFYLNLPKVDVWLSTQVWDRDTIIVAGAAHHPPSRILVNIIQDLISSNFMTNMDACGELTLRLPSSHYDYLESLQTTPRGETGKCALTSFDKDAEKICCDRCFDTPNTDFKGMLHDVYYCSLAHLEEDRAHVKICADRQMIRACFRVGEILFSAFVAEREELCPLNLKSYEKLGELGHGIRKLVFRTGSRLGMKSLSAPTTTGLLAYLTKDLPVKITEIELYPLTPNAIEAEYDDKTSLNLDQFVHSLTKLTPHQFDRGPTTDPWIEDGVTIDLTYAQYNYESVCDRWLDYSVTKTPYPENVNHFDFGKLYAEHLQELVLPDNKAVVAMGHEAAFRTINNVL
ncbi:hypothetical protein BDV95DRAFT_601717 [Massariosphaeria phaeospora]|uniref:Uncharacterized protein n=1 Tax=Massariosphaeria phaeospora TaxID=100035 RepID=A0A7C8IGV3_9PLEO|nr:hypothetical protein BDV95DRAFT_601717 [Massariosphaeria phaeospora]